MSEVVKAAVDAINKRLGADGFDGSIRVEIEDEDMSTAMKLGAALA